MQPTRRWNEERSPVIRIGVAVCMLTAAALLCGGCFDPTAAKVNVIEAQKLTNGSTAAVALTKSVGGTYSTFTVPPGAPGNPTSQPITVTVSPWKKTDIVSRDAAGNTLEVHADPVPGINAYYQGSLGLDSGKQSEILAILTMQRDYAERRFAEINARIDQGLAIGAPFIATAQQQYQNRVNQQQATSTQPAGPGRLEQGLDLITSPQFLSLLDRLNAMRQPPPKG